jgi:hypothetical protein
MVQGAWRGLPLGQIVGRVYLVTGAAIYVPAQTPGRRPRNLHHTENRLAGEQGLRSMEIIKNPDHQSSDIERSAGSCRVDRSRF